MQREQQQRANGLHRGRFHRRRVLLAKRLARAQIRLQRLHQEAVVAHPVVSDEPELGVEPAESSAGHSPVESELARETMRVVGEHDQCWRTTELRQQEPTEQPSEAAGGAGPGDAEQHYRLIGEGQGR